MSKTHRVTVRNKTPSEISTGMNTIVELDGVPLRYCTFFKFELKPRGLGKVTIELLADIDLQHLKIENPTIEMKNFDGEYITETSTIEAEYFMKPVTTTNLDFMYRFKAPVATVWQDGQITHAQGLQGLKVEDFVYDAFHLMLHDAGPLPESHAWMNGLTAINCTECDLTPKVKS